MPHYRDGTPAQVGDQVKGTGYNVKDADGKPKVIFGTVVGVTPGSTACNIQVAHVVALPCRVKDLSTLNGRLYHQVGVIGCGPEGGTDDKRCGAIVELEYGQCDAFEKVG